MMSNVLAEFLEIFDHNRLTATMLFMIGKMLYCYLKDLRRKSRYWHAAKSPQPLPDRWDAAIEEELQALQPIMDTLKIALSQGSPGLNVKI